jgi:hypothetical protein
MEGDVLMFQYSFCSVTGVIGVLDPAGYSQMQIKDQLRALDLELKVNSDLEGLISTAIRCNPEFAEATEMVPLLQGYQKVIIARVSLLGGKVELLKYLLHLQQDDVSYDVFYEV